MNERFSKFVILTQEKKINCLHTEIKALEEKETEIRVKLCVNQRTIESLILALKEETGVVRRSVQVQGSELASLAMWGGKASMLQTHAEKKRLGLNKELKAITSMKIPKIRQLRQAENCKDIETKKVKLWRNFFQAALGQSSLEDVQIASAILAIRHSTNG